MFGQVQNNPLPSCRRLRRPRRSLKSVDFLRTWMRDQVFGSWCNLDPNGKRKLHKELDDFSSCFIHVVRQPILAGSGETPGRMHFFAASASNSHPVQMYLRRLQKMEVALRWSCHELSKCKNWSDVWPYSYFYPKQAWSSWVVVT